MFLGSANGITGSSPADADVHLDSNKDYAYLGVSVSGAGDVNGDGYDDVIVGAHRYNRGSASEGIAVVFLGNPATAITGNNPLNAHAILESNQEDARFGTSVSGAGDVNSDGYDDIIVGAPSYNNGSVSEGIAVVFLGSASGVQGSTPATAHSVIESNQVGANFGVSVSGVGDVNSDGYDDIVIGADLYDNGENDEGAVFFFLGSYEGIRGSNPAFAVSTIQSNQTDAQLGYSVAGVGDINGNGLADTVAGASFYENGETDEGIAIIIEGSPPGVGFASAASDGEESVTTVPVEVALGWATLATCTVDYTITGGSATGGGVDYTLSNGTLTFVPGDISESFPLIIIDDAIDEPSETVQVTLSNPGDCSLGTSTHTYTILDDDPPPDISFDSAAASVSETAGSVNLPVSLAVASALSVEIEYSVVVEQTTATGGGIDYTLLPSGTLSFSPGETEISIGITIEDDQLDEDDETVVVILENPVNADLVSPSTYTLTIADDEDLPQAAFTSPGSSGSESATSVNLPVSLSRSSSLEVEVNYAVSGGTAGGSAVDFTLIDGILIFAPGETAENIVLSVVNDVFSEEPETV